MTGRYSNGYDWMPSGLSSAGCKSALGLEGWFVSSLDSGGNAVTIQPFAPGRYGYGNRLQWGGFTVGNSFLLRSIGSNNSAGGFVSQGMFVDVSNTTVPTIGVYDGVNNYPLITVAFTANGVIRVYKGAGLALLGASDVGAYQPGVEFDVECFIKINSSVGEVEVRVDTNSVIHLTNTNTQPGGNSYFDSVFIGVWNGGAPGPISPNFWVDDFRYYDTAGAINNGFLGTCRVQTSLVSGDGGTLDFTRSNTGLANWQNIANQSIDDSLYLFDPNVGDYNLSIIDPLVNSPTVFWVQVTGFYRQDDATQRYVKNRIVSSGTTADGTAFATPQTYAGHSDVWELDPHTGVVFTGAGVNALQIGPLVYN